MITLITILLGVIGCSRKDNFNINRPETPRELFVTRGDTSVFITWKKVEGNNSYVVVRNLKIIADDIIEPSYVDVYAPDSMVEYRVYSKNIEGWRSYRYASDSGFAAIPNGLLPRAPKVVSATDSLLSNVTVTWKEGRFANSFKIYRSGVLIGDSIKGDSFIDSNARAIPTEYRVYSMNNNGTSVNFTSDVGQKALFYKESFESMDNGYVINPWTFGAPTVAFYTEGGPFITNSNGYDGSSKSVQVNSGKIELVCSWGGVPLKGKYKFRVAMKKLKGGVWMIPSFQPAENISASGEWVIYEVQSPVVNKGGEIKLKIEPYGEGPAFIDNFSIEYLPVSYTH